MTITIPLLLLIVAAILLLLAAINTPSSRVSLGWMGLFFWVVAIIVGGLK